MDTSTSATSGSSVQLPVLTAEGTRPQVRRKARMIAICLECRRRKIKCDKQYPCMNCTKFSRECLYLSPAMEMIAKQRAETNTVTNSESPASDQLLGHDSQKKYSTDSELNSSTLLPPGYSESWTKQAFDDLSSSEYEHYLEPVPTSAVTVSYGDENGDPELDLGVSIGKMWMTDRIGGLYRPNIHKEIDRLLRDSASDRRTVAERQRPLAPLADEGKNFLGPRSCYIEPRLILSEPYHGDAQREAFLDVLPSKSAADALLEQYHTNVHSITPTFHWPTFLGQYRRFWRTVAAGLEPAPWLQAMVFATFFAAVASVAGDCVNHLNRASRIAARDRMQMAAENALCAARVLHASRLEVLQALVTLLLPMYGTQVSKAHVSLVGMAVVLAESLGLHKEPAAIHGLSEIERQVRRLLWFHLSALDLRINYAHSPRLLILEANYDTRMPFNVDEVKYGTSALQEEHGWSAMTFCRIRFECVHLQKVVWHDREKLERNELSVTQCLGKIESFRKDMETQYGRCLDHTKPIQKYTRLVLNLLVQNCYVMILFRYLKQYGQKVPDRLRQLTLHAAVLAMESAIEMDRSPDLVPWKWHNGSYHQWQIAFLLLSHINRTPYQAQAKRIWNIIDYVFEIEPSLSPAMKIRSIMTTIGNRTRSYQNARKLRTSDSTGNSPLAQLGMNELRDHNSAVNGPHIAHNPVSTNLPSIPRDQPPSSEPHPPLSVTQSEFSLSETVFFPTGLSGDDASNYESQIDEVMAQIAHQRAPAIQDRGVLPVGGHGNGLVESDLSALQTDDAVRTSSPKAQDLTTSESNRSWTESWGQDIEMADIDWTEWDQIFPHETYIGF